MKKTITIFATAAILSTASYAQYHEQRDNNYGNNQGREVAVNNNRDRNNSGYERSTYYFSARERDRQISAVNNRYYWKIESIKNKFFMGRSRKAQLIYSLQLQRDAEIRSIFAQFNDRRNQFNRGDNRYDGHDKRNNRYDGHDKRDNRYDDHDNRNNW